MSRLGAALKVAGQSVRSRILAGIVVIVPLLITLWVIRFLFNFLDGWLRPIQRHYFGRMIPGTGFLATVLLLYLIGLLVRSLAGRPLMRWIVALISRLPLIGDVYGSSRQIMEAVSNPKGHGFRRVVMIEFPRPGVYSIGFLTRRLASADGVARCIVFVPTVPNPTTGFLLILSESEVTETDLDVDDAVKMLVSAGVVTPAGFPPQKKSGSPPVADQAIL